MLNLIYPQSKTLKKQEVLKTIRTIGTTAVLRAVVPMCGTTAVLRPVVPQCGTTAVLRAVIPIVLEQQEQLGFQNENRSNFCSTR